MSRLQESPQFQVKRTLEIFGRPTRRFEKVLKVGESVSVRRNGSKARRTMTLTTEDVTTTSGTIQNRKGLAAGFTQHLTNAATFDAMEFQRGIGPLRYQYRSVSEPQS